MATVGPARTVVFDEQGLWSAAGGDLGEVRDRVERFLKDSPRQLAEMAKAIDSAARRMLRREAQALRGAAESVGGWRMADAALRLEELSQTGSLQEAGLAYAAVATELRELRRALLELLGRLAPGATRPGAS